MLSYESTGNGSRAVVFLHGFAGSRGWWWQQMREFSAVARCLTVDLPGHGDSDGEVLALSDMARQLLVILRQEGLQSVNFVASSFGGLVALEVWRQSPESMATITLAGSLPRFTACEGFPAGLNVPNIRKLAGQFEGDVGAVLEIFFRSLFTAQERGGEQYSKIKEMRRGSPLPRREALLGMLDILERDDLRDLFASVNVPVQIINGDGDYICPLAAVASLKTLNPATRVSVFRDCGHFPFLSFPQDFNRVLREFARL